jgi:hypothetical protein
LRSPFTLQFQKLQANACSIGFPLCSMKALCTSHAASTESPGTKPTPRWYSEIKIWGLSQTQWAKRARRRGETRRMKEAGLGARHPGFRASVAPDSASCQLSACCQSNESGSGSTRMQNTAQSGLPAQRGHHPKMQVSWGVGLG